MAGARDAGLVTHSLAGAGGTDPWLWLGVRCSLEHVGNVQLHHSSGTWSSPHLLQAPSMMWFCLQGVSDLGSACGLYIYTNI